MWFTLTTPHGLLLIASQSRWFIPIANTFLPDFSDVMSSVKTGSAFPFCGALGARHAFSNHQFLGNCFGQCSSKQGLLSCAHILPKCQFVVTVVTQKPKRDIEHFHCVPFGRQRLMGCLSPKPIKPRRLTSAETEQVTVATGKQKYKLLHWQMLHSQGPWHSLS